MTVQLNARMQFEVRVIVRMCDKLRSRKTVETIDQEHLLSPTR